MGTAIVFTPIISQKYAFLFLRSGAKHSIFNGSHSGKAAAQGVGPLENGAAHAE